MGLVAGINAARQALAGPLATPPGIRPWGPIGHLTNTATKNFQPMNVNFGLFSRSRAASPRNSGGAAYAARALHELEEWQAGESKG